MTEFFELAKSNPATLSALAAFVTATLALLSLIVTSFVSWSLSRRQIRASVISSNRQAWINALRDDLSELSELLEWLYRLRPGTFSGEDGYRHVDARRSRVRFLVYRIRLRLNPYEPVNNQLLEKIEALQNRGDEFDKLMDEMMKISQSILKAEWDRVKKGH